MATIEDYVKQSLENKNSSSLRRNQFNPSTYVSTFKSDFSSDFGSNFTSSFGYNQDLDSPEGLYQLASQVGLKKQADRIVTDNSGEDMNKVFSGGFISDVFDVLNLDSYGMVGLLKGKGFNEGITNRESFSDKDSLGQYGLSGILAGIVLDIAVSPLTYIAPWTVLKKVPGVITLSKAVKSTLIGKQAVKIAGDTGEAYTTFEGGLAKGKIRELTQKVAHMFGADPAFKEAYETAQMLKAKDADMAVQLTKQLAKLDKAKLDTLLQVDETGRMKRTNLADLQRDLPTEDFALVEDAWNTIDAMGKRMVDLGRLSTEKFEENLGSYIKSVYKEYELASKKGLWGFRNNKLSGGKSRSKELTQEGMEKLGQVKDPAYLVGRTIIEMSKDIHNAELLKAVAKFGSKTEFENSVKVPDTRLFETTQGWNAEAKKSIMEINQMMTPLLTHLKSTFKADKKVLSEIKSIEKTIAKLSSGRSDELFKFFNEGEVVDIVTNVGRKLGVVPERLQLMAEKVKKFDTFEEMIETRTGIELQKMYENGVLQRNSFNYGKKSMEKFFEQVKKPYKPAKSVKSEKELVGNIPKIIKLQKRIESLTTKVENLKDIDKKSINNSFINLERSINELRLDKDDLIQTIHNNKFSDLAGKWIPKEMWDYVNEIIEPGTPLGAGIVGEFKYMKVVLNPGTHVRNTLSNRLLNWWKLGIGPWRLDLDIKARQAIKGKGKYWKEWREMGGGADTYAANELRGMLDSEATSFVTGKLGNWWNKGKQKLGDIYQGEEAHAKLSAFIGMREKGISIEEAFKGSQSATFNYAQVTPFIRKMRTAIWGMPFITFPLKATPIAIETMLGKGTGLFSGAKGIEGLISKGNRVSVFGKIKNSLFQASDIEESQRELESEPAWVKEGFFMKLPWKDEHDRSMYFDLTYILPFGDIVSGGVFQRQLKSKTGTKEAFPLAIGGNNPVFQVMKELSRNETFSGQQIWQESDDQYNVGLDIMNHLLKTFSPPWVAAQMPEGYDKETGERKGLTSTGVAGSIAKGGEGTRRDFSQELFSYLGMKIQSPNVELNNYYQEANKKQGLTTLLQENGILKEFHRNYIPKTD